jgi:hypothetical protein
MLSTGCLDERFRQDEAHVEACNRGFGKLTSRSGSHQRAHNRGCGSGRARAHAGATLRKRWASCWLSQERDSNATHTYNSGEFSNRISRYIAYSMVLHSCESRHFDSPRSPSPAGGGTVQPGLCWWMHRADLLKNLKAATGRLRSGAAKARPAPSAMNA